MRWSKTVTMVEAHAEGNVAGWQNPATGSRPGSIIDSTFTVTHAGETTPSPAARRCSQSI